MAAIMFYAVEKEKTAFTDRVVIAAFFMGFLLRIMGFSSSFIVLAAVLASAVYTDVRYRLIPNRLVFPAVLLGLVLNMDRPGGLLFSLTGLAMGFGIMFVLYMTGGMAGGDAKLAAAVGALMGPFFVTGALSWAVLFSSLVGIAYMAAAGRFVEMLKFTLMYFKYLLFKFLRMDMSREPLAKADVKMPFAVFVLLGCIFEILFPGVMYHWLESFLNVLGGMSAVLR